MVRIAVLNLRDTRPVWSIADETARRLAAAFPYDWQVRIVQTPADSRGDGGGASAEALEAARGAEVYIGYGVPPGILRAARDRGPGLRWAHTGTAGVASLLHPDMLASDVLLTNSAGVHAPAIAETVIAMILHFARGLDFAVRAQAARRWDTAPFETWPPSVREIDGATLGIVGLGGIGREVAARGRALGMHVIATRRTDTPAPAGIELIRGDDALDRLLSRSDVVVLCAPATPATRGLLDRQRIARLRSTAILVNVARGDLIDETALADALRERRLRGAALDVFHTEPLPADSPLRDLPNLLITPHVSGTTDRFWERESALILDNVSRYIAGRPLRNLVDRRTGY